MIIISKKAAGVESFAAGRGGPLAGGVLHVPPQDDPVAEGADGALPGEDAEVSLVPVDERVRPVGPGARVPPVGDAGGPRRALVPVPQAVGPVLAQAEDQ